MKVKGRIEAGFGMSVRGIFSGQIGEGQIIMHGT